MLQGITSVLGEDVPVLGGSAIGIITNNTTSYSDCPAGIVVVEDAAMQMQVSVAGGFVSKPYTIEQLGRAVKKILPQK